MDTPGNSQPEEPEADVLDALLRARGLRRYGVFLATGEGERLPDGSESESGYVLDGSGAVHFYWLDWDAEREAPVLKMWERVETKSEWGARREYQLARQQAGVEADMAR